MYGTRRIKEEMRRKGSEWCRVEIRGVDERKKETLLVCRRRGNDEDLEKYRRLKRMVKKMVREERKRVINEE